MTSVQLTQEKCVACRADSPHATDQETAQLHLQIFQWTIIQEERVRRLQRVFRFPTFAQALAFTNRVGALAEADGHHPRLVTEWGRVTVTWWTHAIRDLHRNDFILAAKTDQSYEESVEAQGL